MVTDSADYSKEAPEDGNAERAGDPSSVLVVGAGPTGLLLASELQRRGVPCHLIDARSGPLHWDRATVVHPRSLEVFESLGLIGRFLDAGTRQRAIKIHSEHRIPPSFSEGTLRSCRMGTFAPASACPSQDEGRPSGAAFCAEADRRDYRGVAACRSSCRPVSRCEGL